MSTDSMAQDPQRNYLQVQQLSRTYPGAAAPVFEGVNF